MTRTAGWVKLCYNVQQITTQRRDRGVDMCCYELFTPSGLNIIVR